MRLLIVGTLGGQLTMASKIAMDKGAKITSTASDIRKHGFSGHPAFEVLIAEQDGAFAGLCLTFPSFSTWRGQPGIYVQDLYVEEAFRGQRIGEKLLMAVARRAKLKGAGYLRLSVDTANKTAEAFYERLGITHAGDTRVFIGGRWFTVIGILSSMPLAPEMDRAALIGWEAAERLLDFDGSPSAMYVRTDPDAVDAVRSVIAASANPMAPEEISVSRPSDALAARAAPRLPPPARPAGRRRPGRDPPRIGAGRRSRGRGPGTGRAGTTGPG